MGSSRDDFTKYPRTPHLFGSRGTDDDKHLGQQESMAFIADPSLIVEEKLDGTNVGIHFLNYGARVELVYVEPPLAVIFQQNERRARPVPRTVIQRLADRLEPPTWAEAHGLNLVG